MFDLEKAKAVIKNLENFTFASGQITVHHIQTAMLGGATLDSALAEIERLRAEREVWITHYNDVQEANATIEDLTSQLRNQDDAPLYNQIRGLEYAIETKDAHIKELEIALEKEISSRKGWQQRAAEAESHIYREENVEGKIGGGDKDGN